MADGINIRVRAVGLQKDVENQARAAQKAISRQPIKLSLDSKAFQQPLGRISGDMSEFQKSLDASTARVFAFGATVGVINGVADAFKATTQAIIDVEKSLTDINVIMQLTASQLKEFSDSLFDVAQNTSQTFSTVAEAATEFARQGLTAEETLQRVNDALILTRLSGLDATASVEALTATMNGFAKAGLNTTDIINRLANVDAAFAVSTKDLADALSRSGATAQSAGVEFNELLAIVTSVQQQTARGGAVIGNAFKSIFTRIQRSGVRDVLEEIGVATTDSAGNFRSAISILQDYARVYSTLTDAQQAFTAEQIAGVYQINNLKALISDLNNEFSIYGQALSTAASTTDQAIQRNEELNKTFAAIIAQTIEGSRELAQAIGELALAPGLEKVLTMLNSIVESMNNMMDEETGNKAMQGFFKGIGNFISGPGLAIVAAGFGALMKNVTMMAANAVKDLFKINTESSRQKALQEGILQVLLKDEAVYQRLINAGGDQNKQAQILLQTVRQISAEYSKQQGLISSLSKSSALRGVTFQGGQFKGATKAAQKKIGSTAAEGYAPNEITFIPGATPAMDTFAFGGMPEVKASMDAGYAQAVQPHQVREMSVPNMGNVMYNTQERVVKMPNMAQPFIVPPTSSKAYPSYANTVKENFGEKMGNMVLGKAFTPAQRSFAEGLNPTAQYNSIIEKQSAKGLVPNYIFGRGDEDFDRHIVQPSRKTPIVQPQIRLNKDIAKILKSGGKNPDLEWDGSNFKSGYKYEFEHDGKTIVATGKEFKELFSKSESGEYSIQKESRLAKAARDPSAPQVHKINEDVSMLVPLPMGNAATQENVIISGQELLKTISLTEIKKLGLVPEDKKATGIKEKLKNNLINDTFQVGFKTSGIQEFNDNVTLRDAIDRDMSNAISGIIKNNANKVLGSKSSTFKLNTADIDERAKSLVQQNSSLAGFLFEEVISSAINKSSAFDGKEQYRRWDFDAGDRPGLNEIFDRAVGKLSDTKRTPSPLAKISIGKKSLFATPQGNQILRTAVNSANGFSPDPVSFGGGKQLNKNIKNAASGLVPNFAKLRDSQKAFANIGRKRPRAVALDVDDTLMHTSKSVEKMGLSGRDKFKAYSDPEISKQIAKTAPLTPLGKRIQNLKNKDDVFIITAASPYRNSVLADRFGIPENKILSLQDQKIIQQFGLDQKKPSKRGISRREKDPNYQLGTKADDFRKLNTGEQKRKVLDSFVKIGIRPTLYDDNLEVLKEAGQYGRRVQYAAEGLVPNFASRSFRSAAAQIKENPKEWLANQLGSKGVKGPRWQNAEKLSEWPMGETTQVARLGPIAAKQYNSKGKNSFDSYKKVYDSLSPSAKKLFAKPLGQAKGVGLFKSLDKSHELLDDQYVPEVAQRMRRMLEGENIRAGGLTGSGGEWGDLRYGNIMVKKGALKDPKIQKIREQAIANNKIPMDEIVDYLWKKNSFKIIDASLVVNKGIHPGLEFLKGGNKARASKEAVSSIQEYYPGIKFSKKGYGKEENLHYVDTFDEKSRKVFGEVLEERRALQKRMFGFGAGLIPNLAGRGDNKETSSRIYESVLATNSYGMNVPFEDTRVENIEINGQKQPVAVNSREKIFKTGKDVQRHFGLDSRPSGGMVLAPQNTAAGKENRKEFASKVENAADGIVPNFESTDVKDFLKNGGSLKKSKFLDIRQARREDGKRLRVAGKTTREVLNELPEEFTLEEFLIESEKQGKLTKDFYKRISADLTDERASQRRKRVSSVAMGVPEVQNAPTMESAVLRRPGGDVEWRFPKIGLRSNIIDGLPDFREKMEKNIKLAVQQTARMINIYEPLRELDVNGATLDSKLEQNLGRTQLPQISGQVFDTVIKTLAQQGPAFGGSETATIDIMPAPSSMNTIFANERPLRGIELKNSSLPDNTQKMAKKLERLYGDEGGIDSKREKRRQARAKTAAKGIVPNFAFDFSDKRFKLNELPNLPQGLQKGVSDAVQREKDAGVPASQIRVDFPSSGGMVSNFAKMPPVAITNTRDEGNFASASKSVARGIQNRQNGIRWAKASGLDMDPLTGKIAAQGLVPNYANQPVYTPLGEIVPDGYNKAMFVEDYKKANKKRFAKYESSSGTMKQSLDRELDNAWGGTRKEMLAGNKYTQSGSGPKTTYSKTAPDQAAAASPSAPAAKTNPLSGLPATTSQPAASTSRKRRKKAPAPSSAPVAESNPVQVGPAGQTTPEPTRLKEIQQRSPEIDTAIQAGDQANAAKLIQLQEKQIKAEEKRLKEIEQNTQLEEEKKNTLKQQTTALKKQKTQFNKQFQKGLHSPGMQNLAFAAPMVLSMGTGFLPQGEGGTGYGMTMGGLGGAMQGASMGAMGFALGPIVGGITTALGAAVGGAWGAMEKMEPTLEELTKSFSDANSQAVSVANATSRYAQIQEQLNNAIESGDESKIAELQTSLNEAFANIESSEVRDQIMGAGSDLKALGEILKTTGQNAQDAAKDLQLVGVFKSISDKNKGFLGTGLGEKVTSSKDISKLGSLISSTNPNIDKKGIDKVRGKLKEGDARGALQAYGIDDETIDGIMESGMKVNDVFLAIDDALEKSSQNIQKQSLSKTLSTEAKTIAGFNKKINAAASALADHYSKVANYFDKINGLSEKLYSQNLNIGVSAGTISAQESRQQLIQFQKQSIDASRVLKTRELTTEFLGKTREFESEADKKQFEQVLSDSTKDGGINFEEFNKGLAEIFKDKELGQEGQEAQRKLIKELQDLEVASNLQKASLDLNNRLLERQEAVNKREARIEPLSSDDIQDFKEFAIIQKDSAQDKDRNLISRSQTATTFKRIEAIFKRKGIEPEGAFKEALSRADETRLQVDTARVLTSIPGLNFVTPQDPNYAPPSAEEFFAPKMGRRFENLGTVEKVNEVFDNLNSQENKDAFLNRTLFGTKEYQQFAKQELTDPTRREEFESMMSNYLLAQRESFLVGRKEEALAKLPKGAVQEAQGRKIAAAMGIDLKNLSGEKGGIEQKIAESLAKSPVNLAELKQGNLQLERLTDIESNTAGLTGAIAGLTAIMQGKKRTEETQKQAREARGKIITARMEETKAKYNAGREFDERVKEEVQSGKDIKFKQLSESQFSGGLDLKSKTRGEIADLALAIPPVNFAVGPTVGAGKVGQKIYNTSQFNELAEIFEVPGSKLDNVNRDLPSGFENLIQSRGFSKEENLIFTTDDLSKYLNIKKGKEGAAADLVMKTITPGLNRYVQKEGKLPTDRKDLGLNKKDLDRVESVIKLLGETGYKDLDETSNLTKFLTEIVPSRIKIDKTTREETIAQATAKTKQKTVETSKDALQEIFDSIKKQAESLKVDDQKVQGFSPAKAFEAFESGGIIEGEVDTYQQLLQDTKKALDAYQLTGDLLEKEGIPEERRVQLENIQEQQLKNLNNMFTALDGVSKSSDTTANSLGELGNIAKKVAESLKKIQNFANGQGESNDSGKASVAKPASPLPNFKGHVPNFASDGNSYSGARAKSASFSDGPAAKSAFNREKLALMKRGYSAMEAESYIQYHTPNFFSETNKSFITNKIDEGSHSSPKHAARAAAKLHNISNNIDFYNHNIGSTGEKVPAFARSYHPTATLYQRDSKGGIQAYRPITIQEKLFEQIGKYEDTKLYKKYEQSKKNPEILDQPLNAYLPTKNDVPTIGFGRTENVNMNTTSTLRKEILNFQKDLGVREEKVKKLVGTETYNNLTDNQKVAVNSLAYNVGLGAFGRSKALKRLKSGDHEGYIKEASEFRKQKGKVLQGLVNRRTDEANLFRKPDPNKLKDTHRKLYKGHVPNFADEMAHAKGFGSYVKNTSTNDKDLKEKQFNPTRFMQYDGREAERRRLREYDLFPIELDGLNTRLMEEQQLPSSNPAGRNNLPIEDSPGDQFPNTESSIKRKNAIHSNTLVDFMDYKGGVLNLLGLGIQSLIGQEPQSGYQTVGNVLNAAYPELMERTTVDDLVNNHGNEKVQDLVIKALNSRMKGGKIEDTLSYGMSYGKHPLFQAVSSLSSTDDYTAAKIYGSKFDQTMEVANMLPGWRYKKGNIIHKNKKKQQLRDLLENASNIYSNSTLAIQGGDFVEDLGIFDQLVPNQKNVKSLKPLPDGDAEWRNRYDSTEVRSGKKMLYLDTLFTNQYKGHVPNFENFELNIIEELALEQKQRRVFDQKQFISKIEQQKGEAGVINYYADKIESYNRAISNESNRDRKEELKKQRQNFKNEFLNAYSGDDIIDRRMPLAEKIKQFDELYLNKDQYRTSDVVKTTLLKLEEGQDAFDDWYLNMPPTFRQEMFEKMEQKGHLEKLPEEYQKLYKDKTYVGKITKDGKKVDLTEQQRKDPANIDKLAIPKRVKDKLKKKRGNDLAKTYELDKSLFYAQWLNATIDQREAALAALESADQNKAVEEFKGAVQTGYIPGQSLSPTAIKSLNIKKIAADYNVFPTFLREHLKTGKDLFEAIDAAKRKINPISAKSTKAKKFSGWNAKTAPGQDPFKWSKTNHVKAAQDSMDKAWGFSKRGRLSAVGHVPNFVDPISRYLEQSGAKEAGYNPGAVKSVDNFVYNTAEKFIPQQKLAEITGMSPDGPAIIPPAYTEAGKSTMSELVNKTGMSASMFASKGHIPNFAGGTGITAYSSESKERTTKSLTKEQIEKAAIERRREQSPADKAKERAAQYSPRQQANEKIKGDSTDQSISNLQDKAKAVQKTWAEQNPFKTAKAFYSKTPAERARMIESSRNVEEVAQAAQTKIDVGYIEKMSELLQNSPDAESANIAITADSQVDLPSAVQVRDVTKRGAEGLAALAEEKQNPIGLNKSNFIEYLEKGTKAEASGAISYVDQATMALSLAIDKRLQKVWSDEGISSLNYSPIDSLKAASQGLQPDDINKKLAKDFSKGASRFSNIGYVPNFAGGTGITAYSSESKERTTKSLTKEQIEKAAIERRREQSPADKAKERAAQYSPRQQANEKIKGDSTDQSISNLQDKAKAVQKTWAEQNPFKTAKAFYSKTPAERARMIESSRNVEEVAQAAQTKIDVGYIEKMSELLQNSPDAESANIAITADSQVDLPSAVQVRDVTKRGAEGLAALAEEKQNPIGLNKSNFIEYLEKGTKAEASGAISYVDQATMALSLAIDKRLQKVWSDEGISSLNYSPIDSLKAASQGLQPDDINKKLAKDFSKGASRFSNIGYVPNFAGKVFSGAAAIGQANKTEGGGDAINRELNALQSMGVPKAIASQKIRYVSSSEEGRSDFVINDFDEGPVTNEKQALSAVQKVHGSKVSNINAFNTHGMAAFGKIPNFTKMNIMAKSAGKIQYHGYAGMTPFDMDKTNNSNKLGKKLAALGIAPNFNQFTKLDKNITKGNFKYQGLQTPASNRGNYDVGYKQKSHNGYIPNFFSGSGLGRLIKDLESLQKAAQSANIQSQSDLLDASNQNMQNNFANGDQGVSNMFDLNSIFDKLMNANITQQSAGVRDGMDQSLSNSMSKQSLNLNHDLDKQFQRFFNDLNSQMQKLFDTKMVPESIDLNANLTTQIKGLGNMIPKQFNQTLEQVFQKDNAKIFNGSLGGLGLGNAMTSNGPQVPTSRDGSNPMGTKWFGSDSTKGYM